VLIASQLLTKTHPDFCWFGWVGDWLGTLKFNPIEKELLFHLVQYQPIILKGLARPNLHLACWLLNHFTDSSTLESWFQPKSIRIYRFLIIVFWLSRPYIHGSLTIFNSHWFGCAVMWLYFLQFSWVKKCLQFFLFEVWYRRWSYKLLNSFLANPHFSGFSDLRWWTYGRKKVAIIVFNLNGLLFRICKIEGYDIISCWLLYFCVISCPVH
jgi:hypothetical protein